MKTYTYKEYKECSAAGEMVKPSECMKFIPEGQYELELAFMVYSRSTKLGVHLIGKIQDFCGEDIWLWCPWYINNIDQRNIVRHFKSLDPGSRVVVYITTRRNKLPMAKLVEPYVIDS